MGRVRTRQENRKLRRQPNGDFSIVSNVAFKIFIILISLGLLTQFTWVWTRTVNTAEDGDSGTADGGISGNDANGAVNDGKNLRQNQQRLAAEQQAATDAEAEHKAFLKEVKNNRRAASPESQPNHFFPIMPYLMQTPGEINMGLSIDNADQLVEDTLSGKNPTLAGITIQLQRFVSKLHTTHKQLKVELQNQKADRTTVVGNYITLAKEMLFPLDEPYRGKSVFPIRDDDSIYISLASFRDHLLGETLINSFTNAANPDKLYVGAIIQNCYGVEATCRTGVEVVGTDPKTGRAKTQVSDAPPDINGVEKFCAMEEFKQYCDSGQVRVLYVHDTDATGPAVARYFASKLWGGETYYVQVDAHLEFAAHWDEKYVNEAKETTKYPKMVLSAYPPGFQPDPNHKAHVVKETPGAKLCRCEFSTAAVEQSILRINMGGSYRADYKGLPTQIPFIAAGFFFAHASFLIDVPFDPLLPWCFMGEEIALSMRAWTAGWTIYAPRKNLIAHQYRPGRLGLPKFWESVGRAFGRPGAGFNTLLQQLVVPRIKHMVGYPEMTREYIVQQNGDDTVLSEIGHYGLGTVRTRQEYLDWTGIDMDKKHCNPMPWCTKGELT